MNGILIKRRNLDTDTPTQGGLHVKTKAQTGVLHPQAEKSHSFQPTNRSWGGHRPDSLSQPSAGTNPADPLMCSLRSCGTISSRALSHSVGDTLLQQPQHTNPKLKVGRIHTLCAPFHGPSHSIWEVGMRNEKAEAHRG